VGAAGDEDDVDHRVLAGPDAAVGAEVHPDLVAGGHAQGLVAHRAGVGVDVDLGAGGRLGSRSVGHAPVPRPPAASWEARSRS
ncbi:hypothetical protein DF186_16385, partial [Enterococcus hirae]